MSASVGRFYEAVGTMMGVAKVSNEEGVKKDLPVIGLIFQLDNPPFPDDPNRDENYHHAFISVSAAKALLLDLRDAVEVAVSGGQTPVDPDA